MLKRVSAGEPESVTAPDCIARARQVGPLLEACAARTEAERKVAAEAMDALHGAQLFRMLIPRSCGGLELKPVDYVQAIEEIAKWDASAAWCMSQGSGCSMIAAYLAPQVAQAVFGDPRSVFAWGPTDGKQKAYAVPGGYRVTGRWSFASGLMHASWVGGHCIIVEPDGSIRMGADGKPLDRTMVMPKSDVTVTDVWHTIGLKGTGSNTFSAEDLFVPEDYTLTRESDDERREPGPLYRFTTYQMFGVGFASVALGIARRMLDTFVGLTAEKQAYRQSKVLRENAVVQSQVAICEAKLRASRALLLQTLEDLWDTVAAGKPHSLDERAALRLASVYAAHQAKDVVDSVYHAAGATAIFEANAYERRFRDLHSVIQQVQGQYNNFEMVGQVLLGMDSGTKLI